MRISSCAGIWNCPKLPRNTWRKIYSLFCGDFLEFCGLWPFIHCLDMSLDVTACLKALSSAFCQYRSHTTEQNTKDLERQIDVSGFWYKLFVINSLNFWIRWTYRKKLFQKSVEYVILSRDVFRVIMVVISDNNNSMSIKQITCELVNSKGRGLHVSKFSHCLPECLKSVQFY